MITNKENKAKEIIGRIKENFARQKPTSDKPNSIYLIWQHPYMTAGGDTFISSLMELAGFQNMFSEKKRYPEVTIADLQIANCKWLLLSSEPYPFTQKHIDELQPHLTNTRIMLVDGEMFSWYGSRLQYAPAYFNKLRDEL